MLSKGGPLDRDFSWKLLSLVRNQGQILRSIGGGRDGNETFFLCETNEFHKRQPGSRIKGFRIHHVVKDLPSIGQVPRGKAIGNDMQKLIHQTISGPRSTVFRSAHRTCNRSRQRSYLLSFPSSSFCFCSSPFWFRSSSFGSPTSSASSFSTSVSSV
jgi:hypothetical protein